MRALPFYDDEQNGGFMMLEGILRVEKGKQANILGELNLKQKKLAI